MYAIKDIFFTAGDASWFNSRFASQPVTILTSQPSSGHIYRWVELSISRLGLLPPVVYSTGKIGRDTTARVE